MRRPLGVDLVVRFGGWALEERGPAVLCEEWGHKIGLPRGRIGVWGRLLLARTRRPGFHRIEFRDSGCSVLIDGMGEYEDAEDVVRLRRGGDPIVVMDTLEAAVTRLLGTCSRFYVKAVPLRRTRKRAT